ncbi:endolytic peptidoglycan transglycosylase RlpA [Rouxiella badensis]|uniref:endolytic peptidoglycan transglycosylase RlpA n=1 Tax=Rouxiella badensis TaxID=1646377 RepID=UPI0013EF15E8|nr:endolytic peptidoglycan transglycosylase RlpA [Rouxiella badensis]QII39280.1 endolytic peptidoglycan transglycosylase RlpA [Rouxiella badensis]
MRKEWVGAIIAGLLLSACSSPDNQPQQAAPEPAYNGPVVEIGGAYPVYEPLNANANNDYSANGNSYKIIRDASRFTQTGTATWYGNEAGSNVTASGEEFDPSAMTAAHPTLPIPSYVRVTNLSNGRMLVVRINDRGPFTSDKIIDLSKAAFDRLNLTNSTRVKLDIINVAPDGTLSGPGTIGTTVARQTYALPARPSLGSSDMGTPVLSAPPAIGAAVRPVDNSTLNTQNDDSTSGEDSAGAGASASNGGGFLQAPKPLPAGVLETSEPAPVAADDDAPVASANTSRTAMAAAAPVVAAPGVARPATHQSAPVSGGGYMVQVGALSNPQNAEIWQKSLSKRFAVPGKVQPNGSNYRVQLGPFSSRQQAVQLQQRLSSEAQQQSFVVSASAM